VIFSLFYRSYLRKVGKGACTGQEKQHNASMRNVYTVFR
jgi:hypothetical protein